jgi:hypothetical protein
MIPIILLRILNFLVFSIASSKHTLSGNFCDTSYFSKQELGKTTFKSMLIKGRWWKSVDNGSSKETQRQMIGGVVIGGKMDM